MHLPSTLSLVVSMIVVSTVPAIGAPMVSAVGFVHRGLNGSTGNINVSSIRSCLRRRCSR